MRKQVLSLVGELRHYMLHQLVSSVAQSYLTLCDSMECSTPGFPVHHQLPELTQTHVHWVSDAIQPSHPLSSPPAFNISQHRGLFRWVSSSHQLCSKWGSMLVCSVTILWGSMWVWWNSCFLGVGMCTDVANWSVPSCSHSDWFRGGNVDKKSQFWLHVGTVSLTCFSLLLLL